MRGALFNMLGDIDGLQVLDAFAGSGALSFEALSRGAASAVAIDSDRDASRTILENAATLGLNRQLQVIQANAAAWLRTTQGRFDIILLDPPYDKLQYELLERLARRLTPEGTLVLSWPGKQTPPELPELQHDTTKQYGDGSLHIYRRISR